ncbi:transcription-repair coupling factor, partial [Planctomycetota bacterium]
MSMVLDAIRQLPIAGRVFAHLTKRENLSLGSLVGSGGALIATLIHEFAGKTALLVTPTPHQAETLFEDICYFSSADVRLFPNLEFLAEEDEVRLSFQSSDRWDLIKDLSRSGETSNILIVSSIQALMQGVPDISELEDNSLTFTRGREYDMMALLSWLDERGFELVPMVETPGDFSRRGGIIDIYHSPSKLPVRIEFFGDTIESLREFSVATQTSVQPLEQINFRCPGPRQRQPGQQASLTKQLPPGTLTMLYDLSDIRQEAIQEHLGCNIKFQDVSKQLTSEQYILLSSFPLVETESSINLPFQSTLRFQRGPDHFHEELLSLEKDETVEILCLNRAEQSRLEELLRERGLAEHNIRADIGRISGGVRIAAGGYTLLTTGEIFKRTKITRRTRRSLETAPVETFYELEEGDLVVHINYGIGRFLGMKRMHTDNTSREFFLLEYRDQAKLYVPVTNIELIQKYVGGAKSEITLDRIGSGAWKKRKQQVQKTLRDIAGELIQAHARRLARPGTGYPEDDSWMLEFEDQFPFEETPDQRQAITELKEDLQSPRPMDRLLCGDVGFGKTEVAMRAAFKVATSDRQVAVIAPTTILVQQHFQTFSERMAEYPLTIDYISRFKSSKDIKETLLRAAEGKIDILIGTHRLLSKDVQFRELGLLIVDEEQRFGVSHKEQMKQMMANVDVLTLSATPIPRTLHQSMVGIKDMSTLRTPPGERLAIHTEVIRYDRNRIKRAILRELDRGGQVFFVHNRVKDIENVAADLEALVPDARINIAHGQMPSELLEDRMMKFLRGEFDILVSTSIIENGIDLPNVNTLIVHNATMFGLSDLHQLRGRVGRYKYRAYAYFLLPEKEYVPQAALKRLRAIEEFNELGAGFKIAMRDLEIRGAGNLLGVEQSGHIKNVGYDLYCKLLKRALEECKLGALPEGGDKE